MLKASRHEPLKFFLEDLPFGILISDTDPFRSFDLEEQFWEAQTTFLTNTLLAGLL